LLQDEKINSIMEEAIAQGQESSREYDIGILFVHGIGQQSSGETLTATAGPLLDWLEQNHVDLNFGRTVVKSGAGVAALTEVTIRYEGEPKESKLLLAESCWAESFACPTPLEFAKWIYGPGTSILVRQLAEWLIEAHYRITEFVNWPLKRARLAGFSAPGLGTDTLPAMKGILIALGALVLGPPFQILILLLAGLSMIPFFRIGSLASQALMALASTLGDAEVFCQGLLGREAIRTKVRDDFGLLKGKCRKTVLAAHSQGAAVALEALKNFECRPDLLITYGSGWRKLHQLRDQGPSVRITRYCEFLLPIVTAISILFVAKDAAFATTFLFLVYLLFVFQLGPSAVWQAGDDEKELLKEVDDLLEKAEGMHWVDMLATLDPVPAGMLLRWEGRGERQRAGRWVRWKQFGARFETCLVVNGENPVTDHTSYWQSPDFLRSLADTLARNGMPICSRAAFAEWKWSFVYRRFRCQLRNVCHLAIYAMAAVLYWRSDSEVRAALPLFVPWVARGLKSILEGLQTYAPTVAWLLGALAMIGGAFVWTRLVSGYVWRTWDQYRVTSLLRTKIGDGLLFLGYVLSVGLPLYFLYEGVRSGRIETAGHEAGRFARWVTMKTAATIWIGVAIITVVGGGVAVILKFLAVKTLLFDKKTSRGT